MKLPYSLTHPAEVLLDLNYLTCFTSADTELESDVTFLRDVLFKNYKELSTFDKWSSEVHSGALRYSTSLTPTVTFPDGMKRLFSRLPNLVWLTSC
jgi:hypothetical protein